MPCIRCSCYTASSWAELFVKLLTRLRSDFMYQIPPSFFLEIQIQLTGYIRTIFESVRSGLTSSVHTVRLSMLRIFRESSPGSAIGFAHRLGICCHNAGTSSEASSWGCSVLEGQWADIELYMILLSCTKLH